MAGSGESEAAGGAVIQGAVATSLEQLWKWFKEGKAAHSTGRDTFPVYTEDPLFEIHRRLNDYLVEIRLGVYSWKANPKDSPAGVALLSLSNEEKLLALRAIVLRMLFYNRKQEEKSRGWLRGQFQLLNRLAVLTGAATGTESTPSRTPDDFATLASELFRT